MSIENTVRKIQADVLIRSLFDAATALHRCDQQSPDASLTRTVSNSVASAARDLGELLKELQREVARREAGAGDAK